MISAIIFPYIFSCHYILLRPRMMQEVMMNEKDFIKSVGKAIASKRIQKGLTQSDVAVKLDIEKETVSRLETGAISPTLARLHQLSGTFDCPVRHFFWQTEGDESAQADTIADMIRTLPTSRRESVVKCVEEIVRALQK